MNGSSIKVLICDNTADKGIRLASGLKEKDVYAYTRNNDSTVITNAILTDMPDVVVADLTLRDADAICIMDKIRAVTAVCPQFIIISEINNSFIERQVLESGAAYFMAEPVDPEELYNVIKLVAVKKPAPDCKDAEIIATDLIRSLGIPAHIKGYLYLRTAILECVECRGLLDSVTKLLYPKIAKKHASTPARVERAMRHAIELAWCRDDNEAMVRFLGYTPSFASFKPTNSEFIALAADRISMFIKSNGASEDARYSLIRSKKNDFKK